MSPFTPPERLGDFCYARDFPMRLLAHSSAFPMHEPIGAIQAQNHQAESLYVRTHGLRAAIDAWYRDRGAADLGAALAALGPRDRDDLVSQLAPACPELAACLDGTASEAQWEAFVAAVDLLFWRVPWAREAARMYAVMERRVLRAVQYTLITWEPADVSEQAIRGPLSAVTRRPVTRIENLPPVISGPYREHLTYLAPEEPEQPYLAVLTSYDFTGEWNATLFHELISLNMDITIAVDVVTLNRTRSQRVAEMAYNAAKLVARDTSLVDIRGEQVVHDAREVLGQLKGQTLHAIQVAILVRGKTKEELEANVVTVRDLFGPRLKLLRPSGAQSAALKLFSTLPRKRLDAPWKPRTQLSKVVGCAAGMVGFHRPNQTKGIFVGVDRNGRFPIFINLFERNQAAHMIIAGQSGYGKTVLLNLLAERAASLSDMQVIGIDAFSNGLRVERAIQDCVCFKVGLEHTINPLDVVFGEETEGGWLNNQILHAVGQIVMLLGEPGESLDGKKRFIPIKLETGERGVLSLAVKRLYQKYRVTPQTPASATPGLSDLILVLEEMRDPIAAMFATRLRYFIYGSLTDTSEKTPDGAAFDGQTTMPRPGPARRCSPPCASRIACGGRLRPRSARPPMPSPKHAFVVTARDIAILESLAAVRYLTVQHLQWLHWTERWREQERAAREAGLPNRRPKRAYARVGGLVERGLLVPIRRSVDRATTVYRRLPHCLSLSRAGADLLAAHHGCPLDDYWFYERATRAAAGLEHSLAIGAFYAALVSELAYRGLALHGWAADHVLCTDYDSVTIASVSHPLPIIPDATFALEGVRHFVEIDRGTTRIEQWRKKALAYDAYGRDPRLQTRYGASACTILVVAPSGPRLEAIARTVAGVHQGVAANYRFLTEERVHPLSIRRR